MNRRGAGKRRLNWREQEEEREALSRRCSEDRDELLGLFGALYPQCGDLRNSENVESIITDICGFHVVDRPLSLGQLAVCDFGSKMVSVNSRQDFVHHKTDRLFLRWSTLAHELGHIRLHADEMAEGVSISFYGQTGQFSDARAFQREREADFYAGLFLVPLEELTQERSIQNLLKNRKNGRQMHSASIWKTIYTLASTYKVSPGFMKRCLFEFGWIEQAGRKNSDLRHLKLRF